MPRAIWRGFLRLSLVSCPIYLSPATTRTKSIRLHQVWRATPEEPDDQPDQIPEQDISYRSAPRFTDDARQDELDQSHAVTRITLRPHDPSTGEEIEKEEVVKGYEYQRGQFVTFTAEEPEGPRRRELEGDRFGEVRAALRHRSRLFRQPVLPLSRWPDRSRDAAGDRRGNGRGRGCRAWTPHAAPARADGFG